MNLKVVIANIAVLLVGLLVVELFFGSWFKHDKSRYLNVVKNAKLEINTDNLYPSINKTIIYSRDSFGLRGSFKKPQDIKILSIGGSTTDQRFIDDSETWQMALQRTLTDSGLSVSIANAGIDGQSTLGHIRNFQLWLDHIPNLKPTYCLIYAGINDFYKEPMYLTPQDTILSFKEKLKINSCLYYLTNMIKSNIQTKSEIKISHSKVDFKNLSWTDHGKLDSVQRNTFIQEKINAFKTRLDVLGKVCLARGITPIFLTQPSRMFKIQDGKLLGSSEDFTLNGVAYNGVDFYSLFTRFNQATKDFCNQNNYYCIDVLHGPDFTDEDFYDYSHNTPTGAKKIGTYVGAELIRMNVLKQK